jgi:hypothetical protein
VAVNSDKPDLWSDNIEASVNMFNEWYKKKLWGKKALGSKLE